MATKDTNTGLLSKVAKFVRNPTTNWSDLDNTEPAADVGYNKQALKEMIERKRQNDFVRKREFDQLRKLRNRDPSVSVDGTGRPSFYQSSMPSNIGERAVTLKKIDEIEAQMSKQWWKGKQAGAEHQNAGEAGGSASATDGTAQSSPPVQPGNGPLGAAVSSGMGDAHADFELTQPADPGVESLSPSRGVSSDFVATRDNPNAAAANQKPGARGSEGEGSGFSTSKLFAVELSDDTTDPDLEEAAIRFANGDDQGAEAGLLDVLKRHGQTSPAAEIWTAALFDLYRATGQQDRFEDIAIDFAERFGRSAPAWFSMPEQLGITVATPSISKFKTSVAPVQVAIWTCPAALNATAMNDLHLALANAPLPWHLDWAPLQSIESDALNLLSQLFSSWCTLRVKLRFLGADRLEKALAKRTPSGDKTVALDWWQLRMDALRIMRLQDEFELVALDYCVTFEVSPPAWQDARCGYVSERNSRVEAVETANATLPGSAVPSDAGDQAYTVLVGLEDTPAVVVELVGEIMGDAVDALKKLETGRHQGAGRLVVSCAKLIRVDFSAAGSLLNWVANRENEGCNVQFRDVHRLVGAFFNVIGINEHARVVLRSN
jgi:anti-anti-sigma regulatory factor